MNRLIRLVRRTWHWIGRLARRVAHVTQAAGTRTITFLRDAGERLTDRWAVDTAYRRTLIAALSAMTATLLPHPAAVAAVGALLSEPPARSTHRRGLFLADDEEDDDYSPRRTTRSTDPWTTGPRRLWDDLQ